MPACRRAIPTASTLKRERKIVADRAALFEKADIVIQVLCYGSNDVTGKDDLPLMNADQILIGFLRPFGSTRSHPGDRQAEESPRSRWS